MKVTFEEAWNNTHNLHLMPAGGGCIGGYKATCTYRGKEIYTYINGCWYVHTYRHYRSGIYDSTYPTTRAERKEFTDAYISLCELIINDNK